LSSGVSPRRIIPRLNDNRGMMQQNRRKTTSKFEMCVFHTSDIDSSFSTSFVLFLVDINFNCTI
jgi:hypothetical protein